MARKAKATAAEAPKGLRKVEWKWVPIEQVKPYPGNARVHDEHQVKQIAASIKEFGWQNAILVDPDMVIIAGHGRLMGGKEAGQSVVPIVVAENLTEGQARALRLADNKIALNSTWDVEKLLTEIGNLESLGMNVGLTGFNDAEVSQMLANAMASIAGGEQEQKPEDEWKGMPEFDQKEKKAFRSIVVHFNTQEDVDAFAATLGVTLTDKSRFLWYPEIEIERYADKRYVAEAAE